MQPAVERRYYLTRSGGVMHAKPAAVPDGAREISRDEAERIKAARPRPPERGRPVLTGDAMAAVDLGPVIDELARLHARADAQEAATADINDLLNKVEVERLVGIEEVKP